MSNALVGITDNLQLVANGDITPENEIEIGSFHLLFGAHL